VVLIQQPGGFHAGVQPQETDRLGLEHQRVETPQTVARSIRSSGYMLDLRTK
jgi:hypothetical protein